MVDCFDRIHLQLTDVVLRPLRALQSHPAPSAATVRLPGRGCRIVLTVQKHPADGADQTPFYTWTAQGEDEDQTWDGQDHLATPDEAYWNAVDLIGAAVRTPAPR